MKKSVIITALISIVLLSSSIYFMFDEQVKIDVKQTNTEFRVWIDDKWELGAVEYVNIFDGTTKMRAKNRSVETFTDDDITTIVRTSSWKEGIVTIDTYTFDSAVTDIKMVPVKHDVRVLNAEGKILHFEYRKISYDGPTKEIESPFSFGNRMSLEWDEGAYLSKVYQQKSIDKIIVRYRVDSDDFIRDVRLFDPPTEYILDGNSVYINDTNTYINITPATISESTDLDLLIQAKQFTGDLTMLFGVNSSQMSVSSAKLVTEEVETTTYNLSCDSPFYYNYTTNPNYAQCWYDSPGNNSEPMTYLIWGHSFDVYDLENNMIFWNESELVEKETSIAQYFNTINYEYDNKTTWYYAPNLPVVAGETYHIRARLNVDFGSTGKYDFALYPTSYGTDIQSAIADEVFYFIDPWWDASWNRSRNIEINSSDTVSGVQVFLNVTYDSDMATDFIDLRFRDEYDVYVPYYIESKTDSSWAAIWVVTDLNTSANGTQLVMYYDNPSAGTNQSSASDIWELYSDGSSTTGWTTWGSPLGGIDNTYGNPAPSFSGNGDGSYLSGIGYDTVFNLSAGRTIYVDFYALSYRKNGFVFDTVSASSLGIYYAGETFKLAQRHPAAYTSNNEAATYVVIDGVGNWSIYWSQTEGVWYDYKWVIYPNYAGAETWVDETLKDTRGPFDEFLYYFHVYSHDETGGRMNVDNIRIGTYISEEPSYSIGNENTQITTVNLPINFTIWDGSSWVAANGSEIIKFRCFSTQTGCEPVNQDVSSSQSIYKICNLATTAGTNVTMHLNETFTNKDMKCDDDYTVADAVTLTTSNQSISSSIGADSCINVSCWADYNNPVSGDYFDVFAYIELTE